MRTKEKDKMLEYRLMDVLEMTYSRNKQALESIKGALLARAIKDSNLYSLPSFVLEDALVVIQNGDLKKIKKFYLLNSHKESFQAFPVHSE